MSDKCGWKEELIDGSPEKYVKTGLRFHPCDESMLYVSFDIEPNRGLLLTMKNSVVIPLFCPFCGADIRKPEPSIDEREEIFDKWWNDNLSSQPPLIHPNDSPNMIAKNYCRIGFYGCYELQESQK